MVILAIPTLRRFDLLADCVSSALAGTVKPDRIIVIDNSGSLCPPIPGAEIVLGRQPQSVARAWNDAVRLAGADVIISNDDVVFAKDTIAALLEMAGGSPRAGIVSTLTGLRFCLFWLRWAAYQDTGAFDERFTPAYFEDNDYHWRLTLKGWESPCAYTEIRHEHSATMKGLPDDRREAAHHQRFRACEALYLAKWGGRPGQERYTVPYGVQP